MKKLERIVGFINYEEIDFPFEFDEKSYSIFLYPPTRNVWKDYNDPMRIFDSLREDLSIHEWIDRKELQGVTSEEYSVIFNVTNMVDNYQGFLKFDVNWYSYKLGKYATDEIDGFTIFGHDVDFFYSPLVALGSAIKFKDDGRSLDKFSVESISSKNESLGEYKINNNLSAKIEVTAYANFRSKNWASPINSESCLKTTFSKSVNIKTIVDVYFDFLRFFCFITYRKNVDIGYLELFKNNEQGKRDYIGIFVNRSYYSAEPNSKVKNRVIRFGFLSEKSSQIIQVIANDKMSFQHLCDSVEDQKSYPASRIIMILANFEREYRNIYCQDIKRSDTYYMVKSEIVNLIDNYQKSENNSKRKYAKEFKRFVENKAEENLENSIRSALIDCEIIMTPFVKLRSKDSYNKTINGISKRMGEVRNGIAHSKLDLHFDAIHLRDIKIIEELLYAMRLKKASVGNIECQKAINDLFDENIAI